jgi:hypothetical protein
MKALQKECKWYVACPMKRFYEHGKLDRKWLDRYCYGEWQNCRRYEMEEKGEFHPDSMLPDGSIDETLG